jgi:uncharacterized protein YidB (DUF937 family)
LAIDAHQVIQTLGNSNIQQTAFKLNINARDISAKSAEYLTQLIDRMTPDGHVPHAPVHVLATLMGMVK